MSAGGVNREGFAALMPLRDGHQEAIREKLPTLAAGDSPFARLGGTHFARLTLVTRPDGQEAERLDFPLCLFFAAEFDRPTRDYLEALCTTLSDQADSIFGACIGYPGRRAAPAVFASWMLEHRVPAGFSVHGNPGATAEQIETSLDLRERIIAFALETRDLGPAALRQRWAEQDWGTSG